MKRSINCIVNILMLMAKMKSDGQPDSTNSEEKSKNENKKLCFVIMPISDHPDYEMGHFDRVYEELIKPAVELAGLVPKRADGIKQTHIIILEILKSIVDFEMAICDISSLNPNVMYELGIRQMAQKPVVLIKDFQTKRIFDTGILNDIEYDSSLRVDKVRKSILEIANSLTNTLGNVDKKANSLIELLNIDVKVDKRTVEISQGEKLIMNAIERLSNTSKPYDSKKLERVQKTNQKKAFKIFKSILEIGDVISIKLKDSNQEMFKAVIDGNDYMVTFVDVDTLDFSDYKINGMPENFAIVKTITPIAGELDKFFTEQQIKNIDKIERETGLSLVLPF